MPVKAWLMLKSLLPNRRQNITMDMDHMQAHPLTDIDGL